MRVKFTKQRSRWIVILTSNSLPKLWCLLQVGDKLSNSVCSNPKNIERHATCMECLKCQI